MSRRISVVVLLAGAVAVALAFVGIVWAAGTGTPDLGGPVVVPAATARTTAPSKPTPGTLDPVSTKRADPVKPPPPQQGGDDDDDDDEGDDD
ncbi:hypothetical protein GCM10009555_097630 [Acrocarpospora macrocephala]|uniref:Small secreted hydrophilic protein n=1 Tax=Acrocarpospora macrocephala TaxID=150177 RepID=A0A5M3WTI0_9ACTN|nr:hypothetical protein [Acrocarpospora macrocephala]GES12655.1 hypothetical protein Amac_062520 [Acrocarpospora macrocephala]